jgi:hypothetical protein
LAEIYPPAREQVTIKTADGDAEATFASTFHLAHLRENPIAGIKSPVASRTRATRHTRVSVFFAPVGGDFCGGLLRGSCLATNALRQALGSRLAVPLLEGLV